MMQRLTRRSTPDSAKMLWIGFPVEVMLSELSLPALVIIVDFKFSGVRYPAHWLGFGKTGCWAARPVSLVVVARANTVRLDKSSLHTGDTRHRTSRLSYSLF
jgi:hypothetical protein